MSYNRSPSASSGSGTVTSVSVTTANGVSGSVATATTTPAITLTLGAITPTTIVASGAISGASVAVADNGTLSIGSQSSAFSSILAAPGTLAANVTLTLPATTGDLGQVMQDTDGNGTLGWRDAGVSQAAVNSSLSVLNAKQVADLAGVANVALTGIQTLDGASTSGASIVLLTAQTDPTENGLWSVNDFGAWTRPPGWLGGVTTIPGSVISISEQGGGVSYSDTLWFGTGDGSSTSGYQRVAVALTSNTGWGSITNVSADKAYNANATTIDELADVLGTLIAQLVSQGILRT